MERDLPTAQGSGPVPLALIQTCPSGTQAHRYSATLEGAGAHSLLVPRNLTLSLTSLANILPA